MFPQEVFLSGVGRYWLTRDLLRSTSIADVLNRTSNLPAAYGVSLNVASLKENRVLNLEIAPGMFPKGGRVTVTEVLRMSFETVVAVNPPHLPSFCFLSLLCGSSLRFLRVLLWCPTSTCTCTTRKSLKLWTLAANTAWQPSRALDPSRVWATLSPSCLTAP